MRLARATIERLVAAAHSAPSGENCQPFTYRWNGSRLRIGHRDARADYRLNAGNHISLLALGCALEAMDIAASVEGLRMSIVRLCEFERARDWLELSFETSPRAADPLWGQLSLRTTDRRRFMGGDPSEPVFAELVDATAQYEDIDLLLNMNVSGRLRDYILGCDRALWIDRKCLHDTAKWVRYTEAEINQHNDGMRWQNLGMSRAEAVGSALARRVPPVLDLVGAFGGHRQTRRILARQLHSALGLGCYATTTLRPDALLRVGRAAMRGWLMLTRAGYGVQPITLPALGPYNSLTRVCPADLPRAVAELFESGLELMRQEFHLPAGRYPVWMYRFGRSTRLPVHMRAPRLPLQQVLSFESDA